MTVAVAETSVVLMSGYAEEVLDAEGSGECWKSLMLWKVSGG